MDIRKPLLVMLNIWRVGADPCVCPPQNITYIIFSGRHRGLPLQEGEKYGSYMLFISHM